MTEAVSYQTEENFTRKIISQLRLRATGENEMLVYEDRPSRKFFAGTLCTKEQNLEKSKKELATMIRPFSMGVEFLVSKKDAGKAVLVVKPSAAFYYRVFPSWQKQLEHMKERFKEAYPDDDYDAFAQRTKTSKEAKQFGTLLLKAYKKIKLPTNFELRISVKDAVNAGESEFKGCKEACKRLIEQVSKDPELYTTKKLESKKYAERQKEETLTVLDALDEKAYGEKLKEWNHNEALPDWNFKISYKVFDFNAASWKIRVTLSNECGVPSGDSVENFLFEANIAIKLENAEFQDFIIDYLKDNYKYDGNVNASGINCSAVLKSRNEIQTEHLPEFKQVRTVTSAETTARFADLAENPLPVLKEILKKMHASLKDSRQRMDQFIQSSEKDIREIKEMRYKDDLRLFENEIERFEKGIGVLEKYPLVVEAFKLMNKSFLSSAKGFENWRLFQIVFITMNIPDVAKSEYKDVDADPELVDVIYFPTGGGKTEAYLGLVVFTAFFDRLRGKRAGVTAITKFPLRLLSLQQLQRIADIFARAEIIRRSHPKIGSRENEPFSMGYYVGKNNTPNVLIQKDNWRDENNLAPLRESKDEREKMLIIAKCPFCQSQSVEIKPDEENVRLLHVCTSCSEVLPVYVSDIEVYRYLPTFIISTLDKIPVCGYQVNFRNIYGQVTQKCPKHGYTSMESCTEKKGGCKVPKEEYEPVELYDPTPTLQIQDEMHLIKESFGSFDAHYETYLINYQKKISGGKAIKIIAATATISDDFHIQISHLYGRSKTSRFPSEGPDRKKSFYAMEDPERKINRIIIGVLPHNKTIRYTVIDLIKYYAEIIRGYWKQPKLLLGYPELGLKTEEEAKKLLRDYTTILEYNLAKRDGSAINQSVGTMINPYLGKIGVVTPNKDEIQFEALTGDVRFKDVRSVLNKLERREGKPEIDLITATSMISHGVDIDSLNFMVFHGMPRNTAEYVQAHSRVGRAHPGIVFIVFNPTRERDQSHYKYFEKFHVFQKLLVESVPINRWAKFSINRTLPGVFTSSLMHYYDLLIGRPRLELTKGFQSAYQEGKLSDSAIKDFILECYQTNEDVLGINFRNVIEKSVEQYIEQILQSKKQQFIPTMLPDKPMTSLRDIDETIEITGSGESIPAMMALGGVSENAGGGRQ